MLGIFPAHAKQSAWVISGEARARVLSGVDTIGENTKIEAALELDMAEGWHTYWKNPGDSGLPPRLGWDKSTNVKNIEMSWPVPQRKTEQGLFTVFSYGGKITFPLVIELEEGAMDTALDLSLQFMACKDICIPAQLDVTLNLDSGDGRENAQGRLIDLAKRKVPTLGDAPKLKINTVVASADTLVVSTQSAEGFKDADLFAYIEGDLAFTAPLEIEEQGEGRAMMKIKAPEDIKNLNDYLAGKTLSLTLKNSRDAIEKHIDF